MKPCRFFSLLLYWENIDITRSMSELFACLLEKMLYRPSLLWGCYYYGVPSLQTPSVPSSLLFPLLTYPIYIMGLIEEFKRDQAISHPYLFHFSVNCLWCTSMEMLGNSEGIYFSIMLVIILRQTLRLKIFLIHTLYSTHFGFKFTWYTS